jgi:uncharacterized protein YciI
LPTETLIVCELTKFKIPPGPEIRAKHLRFLREHGDQGKLLMSGRFADARGAMILWNVGSLKEAEDIARKDPYVDGDVTSYELREWPVIFNYTVNPPVVPPL